MAKQKAVLDVGSQYLCMGVPRDDFYLKIPSVIAVEADSGAICGVGVDAVQSAKTRASGVKLVYPILEGSVIDAEGAKALVSELFKRVLGNVSLSEVTLKVIVPCGMISSDKTTLENLLLSMGVRYVSFTETPVADSYAIFKEFHTNRGVIVNVGSDCTDFAAMHGNGIIAGCTLYSSGKRLTQVIAERVRSKYLVQLTTDQAERLKINCAGLYSNDISGCNVSGLNVQNGNRESINVTSKELYDTVVEFFRDYVSIIESILGSLPDQVAASIRQEGVFLCGGGAKINGLDAFLHAELNVPVRISDEPDNVTITGGLLMIGD